jgi:hypothetical protein
LAATHGILSRRATLQAGSEHSEAFLEFLRSIDGGSRKLPPGNDPDDAQVQPTPAD